MNGHSCKSLQEQQFSDLALTMGLPTFRLVPAGLVLSQLISCITAYTFTPTGQTVELDGVSYYLPGSSVTTLKSSSSKKLKTAAEHAGGLIPLTVVTTNSSSYSSKDFSATVADFLATDDVYSEGFLEGESNPKLDNTINL